MYGVGANFNEQKRIVFFTFLVLQGSTQKKLKVVVLQIRNVYPGSEFYHPGPRIQGHKDFWIPDPHQRIRIVIFYFYPSRIQGVNKAPDPGGQKGNQIPDPQHWKI